MTGGNSMKEVMKEKYTAPEAEVISLTESDIISTSVGNNAKGFADPDYDPINW